MINKVPATQVDGELAVGCCLLEHLELDNHLGLLWKNEKGETENKDTESTEKEFTGVEEGEASE